MPWLSRPEMSSGIRTGGRASENQPIRMPEGSFSGSLAPSVVPALDRVGRAGVGAGVDRRRTDQAAGALLLEDVRRPTTGPGAGEHRGEHRRGDLGEVQDDGRPELDVGLQDAVGTTLLELGQRGLLQGLGDLVARCVQLLGGATQHSGTRVLGRSEEHTSELQSLMRISYAVFCLKKKTQQNHVTHIL